MIKELAWYLEDNRFTGMVNEMQDVIDRYAEAKQSGADEETLYPLRESARILFENHSVRSGLREEEASYINIDAEFFDGETVDRQALDDFMKKVMLGHGRQETLWTYMGTYGSFTIITKDAMTKEGLRYEDYLPIKYKKQHPPKKPLEGLLGENEVPIYLYDDGTASEEYDPEKAKFRFNTLQDRSGMDWKAGYDPNREIQKEGWHGEFDADGVWSRVEGAAVKTDQLPQARKTQPLEIIRDGETTILYDPGAILLASDMMLYLTENGEEYGRLETDREAIAEVVLKALENSEVSRIDAICTADSTKATIEAYRSILKNAAAPGLHGIDRKKLGEIRAKRQAEAKALHFEKEGVKLEQAIQASGKTSNIGMLLEKAYEGKTVMPLSLGKKDDARLLGLSNKEAETINEISIPEDKEQEFNNVMGNLYAAWPEYEAGGYDRIAFAQLVADYITSGKVPDTAITTSTILERLVNGPNEQKSEGMVLYASGIPGVFTEPEQTDWYDTEAREKRLKTLERNKTLPRGGSESAREALMKLPDGGAEQRAKINKAVSRMFGEYRTIAMSTGLPIGEAVSAAIAGAEGREHPTLARKVYYELPLEKVVERAKENRQVRVADSVGTEANPVLVIGGIQGKGLDEVILTRKKLIDEYGYNEVEADKAQSFLHDIKYSSGEAPVTALLAEVFTDSDEKTASVLKASVLTAIDGKPGVGYNLLSDNGLAAYKQSTRFKSGSLDKTALEEIINEAKRRTPKAVDDAVIIPPQYKSMKAAVPLQRTSRNGFPEPIGAVRQISIEKVTGETAKKTALVIGETIPQTGKTIVDLEGFNAKELETKYGYSAREAVESAALLGQMVVPTGQEAYFGQEVSPMIHNVVSGSRNAEALRQNLRSVFSGSPHIAYAVGGASGNILNTLIPEVMLPFAGLGGAVYVKPVQYDVPLRKVQGAGRTQAVSDGMTYNKPVIVEQGNPHGKIVSAVPENIGNSKTGEPATVNTRQESFERKFPVGDAEKERLRRISENYEHDKKLLEKKKAPALARSDTHDVGHADGSGDNDKAAQKAKSNLSHNVVNILRRRAGI